MDLLVSFIPRPTILFLYTKTQPTGVSPRSSALRAYSSVSFRPGGHLFGWCANTISNACSIKQELSAVAYSIPGLSALHIYFTVFRRFDTELMLKRQLGCNLIGSAVSEVFLLFLFSYSLCMSAEYHRKVTQKNISRPRSWKGNATLGKAVAKHYQ